MASNDYFNIFLTQIHRYQLFKAVFQLAPRSSIHPISALEIFQQQFISIHYTKLKGKKAIRESLASRWQKIVLFSSPLYAFGRGKQLHGTNWLIAERARASCCLVSGHQSPALMLLNALLPHIHRRALLFSLHIYKRKEIYPGRTARTQLLLPATRKVSLFCAALVSAAAKVASYIWWWCSFSLMLNAACVSGTSEPPF